jgi:hypothetical protein
MKQQHEAEAARLDAWLRLRASTEFVHLVDKHARSKKTTLFGFVRAALLTALEADGVSLPPPRLKPRERELA